MESISPITLRKALDALTLPARANELKREPTGAPRWAELGVTLLAAALGVAWAISAWG